MPRREQIIRKTKKMTCGHEQIFSTPVPQYGEIVFCRKCNDASAIPKKKPHGPFRVADGRPRRLKSNPRSNNQFTKGRLIDTN